MGVGSAKRRETRMARRGFALAESFLCLTAFLLTAAAAVVPSAQRPAAPRLADTKALRCAFTSYASGTWQKGDAQARVSVATLSIAFRDVDTQDGFATAVGTFGPSDIVVRMSAGNMHLLQVGTSGALYVTTIFPKETKGGRLQAVHTRHEYTEVSLPGFTSRPEQYYGDCEIEHESPSGT
jgi:hypothetical protein